MWLLGRVIPYLIGENMPRDINWKNNFQLLEIVDLLMAPEIPEDEVGELSLNITPCSLTYTRVLMCYLPKLQCL